MGLVHRNGLGGLEKNPEAALAWFKKAAAGGHPNAPANIGRMYWAGEIGGAKDAVSAIKWYDEGLSRGDAWGGANAAYVIMQARLREYGPWDAALRAGKAAALRHPEAKASARKFLARMKPQWIDRATQMLLNDMGADLAADGAFGPGSQAALAQVAAASGESVPAGMAPAERLVWLAGLHWKRGRFRVDLY